MLSIRSITHLLTLCTITAVTVQANPILLNDRTASHVTYDQRQKGEENWMVKIKNVYVALPDLSKLYGSLDQFQFGDGVNFEDCKEPICLDVTDFVLPTKPGEMGVGTESAAVTNNEEVGVEEKPASEHKEEEENSNNETSLVSSNPDDVVKIGFVSEAPTVTIEPSKIPKPSSSMLDENFNLIRKKPKVEIISTPDPLVTDGRPLVEINQKRNEPVVEIGTKRVIQADKEIIIEIGNKRMTEIHPEVTEPSVTKTPDHSTTQTGMTVAASAVEPEPQIYVEITEESKIGTTVPPTASNRKNNKVHVMIESETPEVSRIPIKAEDAAEYIESAPHEVKVINIDEALITLKDQIEEKKRVQEQELQNLRAHELHIVPVQIMMD